MRNRVQCDSDVKVLALVKGDERYVWMYTDDRRDELLRRLGAFAADPRLSLTWRDAAEVAMKAKEIST